MALPNWNRDQKGGSGAYKEREKARAKMERHADTESGVAAAREEAERRRRASEKKQDKAERRAQEQAESDFRHDVGYDETYQYDERMAKLKSDILRTNLSFACYPEDMSKWTGPEAEANKKASEANREYLNAMYALCFGQLANGLSAESVMSCVGVYIGMAVVDKDFRKDSQLQAPQALLPVARMAAKMNCSVSNWNQKNLNSMMSGLEKVTGKTLPGHYKRETWEPKDWRDDRTVRDIQEKYQKAANDGRVPFTPESAAVQYLRFTTSAYAAMRQPGADVEKIKQQYHAATGTLYELAKRDGIESEQLDQNVRTIAGQLMKRYPDFQGVFQETAYDEYVVDVNATEEVKSPTGKTVHVWRGGFKNPVTGKPFERAFTPREPASYGEMKDFADGYCDKVIRAAYRSGQKDGERAGMSAQGSHDVGLHTVADIMSSDTWEAKMQRFANMAEDDVPAFCKDTDEAAEILAGKPGEKMMSELATEIGQNFAKRYGLSKRDEEYFAKAAKEAQAKRAAYDVSDIPDFEEGEGEGYHYQ